MPTVNIFYWNNINCDIIKWSLFYCYSYAQNRCIEINNLCYLKNIKTLLQLLKGGTIRPSILKKNCVPLLPFSKEYGEEFMTIIPRPTSKFK